MPAPHWLRTSPVSLLIVIITSDAIGPSAGFNLLPGPNELKLKCRKIKVPVHTNLNADLCMGTFSWEATLVI